MFLNHEEHREHEVHYRHSRDKVNCEAREYPLGEGGNPDLLNLHALRGELLLRPRNQS